MFQKIFVITAIGVLLISPVYCSDTWPEKYVRKTNNKIWNLIQKRCSTALCKDHLNKLRTERLQSAGKVSGGCKNIYPPPRTYEERLRLCGNTENGTEPGCNTASPSQKKYDHLRGGQKSHYNDSALVEKNWRVRSLACPIGTKAKDLELDCLMHNIWYVYIGAWRSLVAHTAGGRAVAGSNPVAPTIFCSLYVS